MTAAPKDTQARDPALAHAPTPHPAQTAATQRSVTGAHAVPAAALLETVNEQLQEAVGNLSVLMDLVQVAEIALRSQEVDAEMAIANMLERCVRESIHVELERLETLQTSLPKPGAR